MAFHGGATYMSARDRAVQKQREQEAAHASMVGFVKDMKKPWTE